jgi:uncharacterized membrane protein YeaQ/YmgE (transglycosylase-associated protein family)
MTKRMPRGFFVNTDMKSQSRRISGAHLAAEAVGGSVVGLPGALVGGFAAAWLLPRSGNGWDDLIYAILGAIIGYTIGVSLGVYLIGSWLNSRDGIATKRRAYWLALLGSVLGAALVLLAAEPLHLNSNTAVLQTFLFILPPIGATLGFNMRRKARR